MEILLEDTKVAFENEITASWVSADEEELLMLVARAHSFFWHR